MKSRSEPRRAVILPSGKIVLARSDDPRLPPPTALRPYDKFIMNRKPRPG